MGYGIEITAHGFNRLRDLCSISKKLVFGDIEEKVLKNLTPQPPLHGERGLGGEVRQEIISLGLSQNRIANENI